MVALGTLFAIVFGVATGVVAAWRRGTATDKAALWGGLGFYSMPPQWLGLVIVLFIAGWLGLPTSGVKDPTLGILDDPRRDRGRRRPARAHDPARAHARARPLRRVHAHRPLGDARDARRGLHPHVAREGPHELVDRLEARLPQRDAAGRSRSSRSRSGSSSAGAITVEYVFSYPGIGLLIVEAIDQRDYPVLQAAFLLLTLSVIFFNLLADLLYFKLDPRVTE